MSEGPSDLSSSHLEPPSRTTEMQDPGAGDHTASESDDEYFSDASEGNPQPQSLAQSGRTSPVPRTRVERVDSSIQHGETPGTAAFEKRQQDAVPDEIEVIPEGSHSQTRSPAGSEDQSLCPEGLPVPRTVVEKVDPDEPSHGEVPGTLAHEQRLADAVPDVVTKASDSDSSPTPPTLDSTPPEVDGSTADIPETRLEREDTVATEEDLSPQHPQAHTSSMSDALPDTVETVPDVSIDDTDLKTKNLSLEDDMNDDHGYEKQEAGDDFDEFVEEQEDMEDDDFGDFDDGFQEPNAEEAPTVETTAPQQFHTPPPLTDFDTFKSTSELLDSLQDTLNTLFPESQDISSLTPVEPIPDSAAIFSTERSLSLWSQLVAPPPLQPQNWVKSRIRRLFLVSLGVPVDLDEILPASKQKKLILPSIDLESTGAKSPGARSRSRVRKEEGNDNNTEKGRAPSRQKATPRRGAPPAPEIDLSAVRRLCATTDAALNGLTDSELKLHVQELNQFAQRASSVLEYWLKRRDGLVGEKEAFEGVIENLVSHVRRVRK